MSKRENYEIMIDFGKDGFAKYGSIFKVIYYVLKYSGKAYVRITKGVER